MIHAADVGVGVIREPVQPGMIYVKYPGALSPYPVPSTGDKAHPFLWGALLMMSLGLAIVAFRIKHKEQ